MTRAVSGFSGCVSQCASAVRRPVLAGSGEIFAGASSSTVRKPWRDFPERFLFRNENRRCCGADIRGDGRARERFGFFRAEFVQFSEECVAVAFRGLFHLALETLVLVLIVHLPPCQFHDLLLVRGAFRGGFCEQRLGFRREFLTEEIGVGIGQLLIEEMDHSVATATAG